MKTTIFALIIFSRLSGMAQLHSGTPVIHSKPQPVPNSSTTEKSAPPQPINIPPAANPVLPIYPGAEAKAVEIPRQLIHPPVTPSGTQPVQKEPLSPVESTNTLQPNRPPRDRASRQNNQAVTSAVISNGSVISSSNRLDSNRSIIKSNTNKSYNRPTKTSTLKSTTSKNSITKKKPR